MKNSSKWLYLMSSNSSKEYILDILETLSLPLGTAQHFRYLVKWLDDDIRRKLPTEEKYKGNELRNTKVLICYLYLEKIEDKWQWTTAYPIRTGILMDSYKTGDESNDIAHFYFRVENYISYEDQNCIEIIRKLIKEKSANHNETINSYIEGEGIEGKTLVFWYSALPQKCLSPAEKSKSAFYKFCGSLKFDYFKSPEGTIEYYPFFYLIEGLKDRRGKFLKPTYDSLLKKSTYTLAEGDRYSFEFCAYSLEKPLLYAIKLTTDERIFSTPKEYKLNVSSRYDKESWPLIPINLERDVWTLISFQTESNTTDYKEHLNAHIDFFIHIKRKISYRIIDVLSDFSFGVGTAAIALSKVLEKWTWWYFPVIGGYALWAIGKLIIKLWRG